MFVSKENKNKLEVIGWLDPPKDSQINLEMANPCDSYPSDHYAIAYEVYFQSPKKKKNKFPKFKFINS